MAKTLEIRLSDLSDQAKELILAKAEEWQTSPEDAMSRLLDELALESEKQSAAWGAARHQAKTLSPTTLSISLMASVKIHPSISGGWIFSCRRRRQNASMRRICPIR